MKQDTKTTNDYKSINKKFNDDLKKNLLSAIPTIILSIILLGICSKIIGFQNVILCIVLTISIITIENIFNTVKNVSSSYINYQEIIVKVE